jgi:hypothetical protein
MDSDLDFFRCRTHRGRAIQAAMGVELAQWWDELDARSGPTIYTTDQLRLLMACDRLFWKAEHQVAQEMDDTVMQELQTILKENAS